MSASRRRRSPRVSVIVPSYQHVDFVEAAVKSALAQTMADVEVLVIDDGSTDGSLERLSAFADPRLVVRSQENRGLSRTLNRGLAEARAEWVKMLPSDDLLEPDCLERQLALVEAEPELGAAFSLPTVVDASNRPLADPSPQAWFDTAARSRAELLLGLLERNALCAPGALFSRARALGLGGFDPSLRVAQDYDLWLRLLALAPARLAAERLVRVRWHGANQSARATPETEAERAYALVRAVAGREERWVGWWREARGGDVNGARLGLAAALCRSGLAEARPFARALVASARAAGAPPPEDPDLAPLLALAPELARPGPWGAASVAAAERTPERPPAPRRRGRGALFPRLRRLGSSIARLRRREPPRVEASAMAPSPGPRRRHWLVLAVVPMADSGGGQRSAQLARALAARGERVLYAARFPRRESARPVAPAGAAGVGEVPWDVPRIRALLREGLDRWIVLAELPEAEVVGLAREAARIGARVLYDKVDAWDRASWADWYDAGDERALVAVAEDLIASARPLARSLGFARRPLHYLPNAVDRGVFHPGAAGEPPPPDFVRGEVTLVYAGALWGEWFDWHLVAGIARARPGWQLLLIGDRPEPLPIALPGNVHLVGLKPQRALPAYLAAADVCLIPFRRSALTEAVSPLKLFEYLGMHRPVVAPPLGELAGVPHVFPAGGVEESLEAIERAASAPAPVAEVEEFLSRHTWQARAESLAAITADPSVEAVVLARGGSAGACARALLDARGTGRLRLTVVAPAGSPGLEPLEEMDERGEIRLLRCARPGAAAAWSLGVEATCSEIVALLDEDQRPGGAGWLAPALDLLSARRELGAVGTAPLGAPLPGRGVAALELAGAVLPRAVLARVGGIDEEYRSAAAAAADLGLRIRSAGWALRAEPGIALIRAPAAPRDAGPVPPEDERRLRGRWRGRPELDGLIAALRRGRAGS